MLLAWHVKQWQLVLQCSYPYAVAEEGYSGCHCNTVIYPLPCKLQSGDTDLERFLVYLCIGVKLLILDTLSTYTYEIDLKNIHLNTPFLLVLNNSMRGGVNNFMPFRKQRLSKCCIFGDIFSKYMNLSIFVLRLI